MCILRNSEVRQEEAMGLTTTLTFSQSPEMQSPLTDHRSPEELRGVPTIVDPFLALSPSSQRLFRTCGSDPFIQTAVLDILESFGLQATAAITSEMADPLLEKLRYTKPTHGKGKRGDLQFYKCLWNPALSAPTPVYKNAAASKKERFLPSCFR
jgi:hypothetical protein